MEILAYSDHASLNAWHTYRDFSKRKLRLFELMSKFPVEVVYRSGELNIASDILARQT